MIYFVSDSLRQEILGHLSEDGQRTTEDIHRALALHRLRRFEEAPWWPNKMFWQGLRVNLFTVGSVASCLKQLEREGHVERVVLTPVHKTRSWLKHERPQPESWKITGEGIARTGAQNRASAHRASSSISHVDA